ncbi:MAG: DUF1743 domain-containing protein [Promethearchaeota archaeon]
MTSNSWEVLHIGIDDTDSLDGMCTTYLGYKLVKLLSETCEFIDFPNLIRLNPNIPLKTRGNGAICIRCEVRSVDIPKVKKLVIDEIHSLAHLQNPKTNSGAAFFVGETIPTPLRDFAKRALSEVLSLHEAKSLASQLNIELHGWKKAFGVIGALAAIGTPLLHTDYTYELIAYREEQQTGKRQANYDSVFEAARTIKNQFNNVDFQNKQVLIFPRGLDPVLCGVRGETPQTVMDFYKKVDIFENIRGIMVFRTNQHTGVHLRPISSIEKVRPYLSALIAGIVVTSPTYYNKHEFFAISDETGKIDCAVYEPTKQFRHICSHLKIGDRITVGGGIRAYPRTLNVEFLYTDSLISIFSNPMCPFCKKSLSSQGRGKGYKCKKCKARYKENDLPKIRKIRPIEEGKTYLPPLCAHRHLTKPTSRFGREKTQFNREELMFFKKKIINQP